MTKKHNRFPLMEYCFVCVSLKFSLNWNWCRAMVFPLKISSTVVFANKFPRLNMLLKMALTSWCVIMKQSCARFLAATPMPSKFSISISPSASGYVKQLTLLSVHSNYLLVTLSTVILIRNQPAKTVWFCVVYCSGFIL